MTPLLLTPFLLAALALAADYRIHLGISQVTGQIGQGFDPNRIVPAAGDTITFSWAIPSYIQNPSTGSYSATQGTFENPCSPMPGGFDSRPQTTAPESAGQAPTMTFTVRDDKPLYFFSTVGDQCRHGMVLGVNTPPLGSGSVESYIIAAGGDPLADTTYNASTPSTTPTNNTANNAPSQNQTNIATSTNTTKPVNSGLTNSTTAKPQNNAALLNSPSSLAFVGVFAAALFL